MRYSCVYTIAGTAAALLCLQSAVLLAQEERIQLRGQVSPADDPGASLSVELASDQDGAEYRAPIDLMGGFEFDGLKPGAYELRVLDSSGRVLVRQVVAAGSSFDFVNVSLPRSRGERPVSGTVSVKQLKRRVPKDAFKEFERAEKADRKQDPAGCVEHLKRAIALFPDYMEAHNNLGAHYLRGNRLKEALAEFDQALRIEPEAFGVKTNRGLALLGLERYQEAEKLALEALRERNYDPKACLVLGLSLQGQGEDVPALQNLERAAKRFPQARIAVAQILARQGKNGQAAGELQAYLDSGQASNRGEIEAWLTRLQR